MSENFKFDIKKIDKSNNYEILKIQYFTLPQLDIADRSKASVCYAHQANQEAQIELEVKR